MELNKIWLFELQDGRYGGFVIADTEEDARKKLLLDSSIQMTPDTLEIYPITALDLNKSVHQLW